MISADELHDIVARTRWCRANTMPPPQLDALLLEQGRLPPASLQRALADRDATVAIAPFLDLDTVLNEVEHRTRGAIKELWAASSLLGRLVALGEPELALAAIEGQPDKIRFSILDDLLDDLPQRFQPSVFDELIEIAVPLRSEHGMRRVMLRSDASGRRDLVARRLGQEPYENIVADWLLRDHAAEMKKARANDPRGCAIDLIAARSRLTEDTPAWAAVEIAAAQLNLAERPPGPTGTTTVQGRLSAFHYPVPLPLRPRARRILAGLPPEEQALCLIRYATHTDPSALDDALGVAAGLSPPHHLRARLLALPLRPGPDPTLLALAEDLDGALSHPDWCVANDLWPGRRYGWTRAAVWSHLAWHASGADRIRWTDRAVVGQRRDEDEDQAARWIELWVAAARCDPDRWGRRTLDLLDGCCLPWDVRAKWLARSCAVAPAVEEWSRALDAHLQWLVVLERAPVAREMEVLHCVDGVPAARDALSRILWSSASSADNLLERRSLLWGIVRDGSGEPRRQAARRILADPDLWVPNVTWMVPVALEHADLVTRNQLHRIWEMMLRLPLYYDPWTALSELCPLFEAEEASSRRDEVICGYATTMGQVFQDTRPAFVALAPHLDAPEIPRALDVVAEADAEDWEKDLAREALLLRWIALDPPDDPIGPHVETIRDVAIRTRIEAAMPDPDPEATDRRFLSRVIDVVRHGWGDRRVLDFLDLVRARLPGDPRLARAVAEAIGPRSLGPGTWLGLARTALDGGVVDEIVLAYEMAPADTRAELWFGLLAAATPEDPRRRGWVVALLSLVDVLDEDAFEDWTPDPDLLDGIELPLVAAWLRRRFALSADHTPLTRAVAVRDLAAWMPVLHRLWGAPAIDAILEATTGGRRPAPSRPRGAL